jgi:hypothetical protein
MGMSSITYKADDPPSEDMVFLTIKAYITI